MLKYIGQGKYHSTIDILKDYSMPDSNDKSRRNKGIKVLRLKNVSHTAFITAYHRSRLENLSGDICAKYLLPKEAIDDPQNYFQFEINKIDASSYALRNKFILNLLVDFFSENKEGVFLNLGSGFSSYAYFLDKNVHAIEQDQEDIISYKKSTCEKLVRDVVLPSRSIDYFVLNLNDSQALDRIERRLNELNNKKCFVLMEGLSPYLNKNFQLKLFKLFDRVISKGSSCLLHLGLQNDYIDKKIYEARKYKGKANFGIADMTFFTADELEFKFIGQMSCKFKKTFFDLRTDLNHEINLDPNDGKYFEHFCLLEK